MYNMLNSSVGITISSDLTWIKPVDNIVAKAGRPISIKKSRNRAT